jgi:hypothetical protein
MMYNKLKLRKIAWTYRCKSIANIWIAKHKSCVMSRAIFENLCMVCWRGYYITLYYHMLFKYDIVHMMWSAAYWLLFLGIQIIHFGYADLSVAPPKIDVVYQQCCVDGHNIDDLLLYTQQDALYRVGKNLPHTKYHRYHKSLDIKVRALLGEWDGTLGITWHVLR